MEVPKDPIPEDVRAAEREIDEEYLRSPLVKEPFARAGWFFLGFCEELSILPMMARAATTEHEAAAMGDNLIVHSKWPLHWLRTACRSGGMIPSGFDDDMYDAAHLLSDLAMKYLDFEAAFTYATEAIIGLHLNGRKIEPERGAWDQTRYDAYDRLTQDFGSDIPISGSMEPFMSRLAASVEIRGQEFRYDLNPKIVRAGIDALHPMISGRFTLPGEWALPGFTIGEFARVAEALWVLAFIHFQARLVAALRGCHAMGYCRALILMERTELVQRLRRYSGVAEKVVTAIIQNLTYGARGQEKPDPALQPIIPLSPSVVAISPNLVMVSSMERNLTALLNRLPEERRIYSAPSRERETRLRSRLTADISSLPLRFWHGRVPEWGAAADVDLAIISDSEQRCLLLELKSFISPAEPREVIDRSKEIQRGIEQIRARKTRALSARAPLDLKLGTNAAYQLSWAVVSQNSVGAAHVQSADVPVLNARHLAAKLVRCGRLSTCCDWLDSREYLPVEGVHYRIVEASETIAGWTLNWYRVLGLKDDYVADA
jgi:hypothetical protein